MTDKRRGQLPEWTAAVLGLALGAGLDILPFRLEQLGLTVSGAAGRWGLHALSGVLTAAALWAIVWALRREREVFRIPGRAALLLFLALNALTAVYVCTSRTVYVWDNAGYWTLARNLANAPLGRAMLLEVLRSTVTMDYNELLAFPISLVMRLFGESRAVFIFCITDLYTYPAALGLCALTRRHRLGGLALAGCLPMLAYIGCVGFVDTAACAAAVWALVFYRRGEDRAASALLAGVCLCLSFLLRRYFFFYACAFCAAAALEWLLLERRRPGRLLILFCALGLAAVYATLNFLLDKVVGGGFGDLYSAYDLGRRYDLLLAARYFGLLPLVALLGLGILGIMQDRARGDALFALLLAAVCCGAFMTVQTHGQQHLLMYVPPLALLLAAALDRARRAVALAAAALSLWCLVPKAQPGSLQEIPYPSVLPSFVYYGPKREDIGELRRLADDLDALSAEGPKTAAVLSSSLVFNLETLSNLRASLNLPAPAQTTTLLYQGTVDRVNAMNWDVLRADYLLVADPVQTHLGEDNQAVIALLAHDLLDRSGPGTAYEPLPERYALQNGVSVSIYARVRELTEAEYALISGRLLERYPEYTAQYGLPSGG